MARRGGRGDTGQDSRRRVKQRRQELTASMTVAQKITWP